MATQKKPPIDSEYFADPKDLQSRGITLAGEVVIMGGAYLMRVLDATGRMSMWLSLTASAGSEWIPRPLDDAQTARMETLYRGDRPRLVLVKNT